MEERLNDLEIRISFQDQIIEDLNKVVIELRKKVEKMESQNKKMIEILDDANLKDPSLEVPPPHY